MLCVTFSFSLNYNYFSFSHVIGFLVIPPWFAYVIYPLYHPYLGPVLLCEEAQIIVVFLAESLFSKMENDNAIIAQNIFDIMTNQRKSYFYFLHLCVCFFFAEIEVIFCCIQQGTCLSLKFCMLSLFLITVQICGSEGAGWPVICCSKYVA